MRHLLVVGLVLAVVAPLSAQTIVEHMAADRYEPPLVDPNGSLDAYNWNTHCLGFSGGNGRSKPTLLGWGESSVGVAAAEFDKAELQAAIDDAVATYGSWNAQILVTQVNWIGTPMPLQFHPVVGSADVGSTDGTYGWQGDGQNDGYDGDPTLYAARRATYAPNPTPPPTANWTDPGGTVMNFDAAVLAGVGTGQSALDLGPSWTQEYQWPDSHPAWTVLIDATSIVQHYLSSDALLLFASAVGDVGMTVFGANQWGGAADIRVQITPEPVSLALLAMGGLVALRRRR